MTHTQPVIDCRAYRWPSRRHPRQSCFDTQNPGHRLDPPALPYRRGRPQTRSQPAGSRTHAFFFFFSPDDALIGAVLGPELKPPGSALSDICLVTFLVARAATNVTARLFPWIRILVCSVLQRSPSAAHHHRCSPTHLTQGTSPLLSVWHCVVVGYLDSCCRQS